MIVEADFSTAAEARRTRRDPVVRGICSMSRSSSATSIPSASGTRSSGSGNIMLGGRSRTALQRHGLAYPFAATLPLLRRRTGRSRQPRGPIAQRAERQERKHSYRVHPRTAAPLADAGFRVLTLANNHLVDCGREGVVETLLAVERAGIARIGAGYDVSRCAPAAIFDVDGWRRRPCSGTTGTGAAGRDRARRAARWTKRTSSRPTSPR